MGTLEPDRGDEADTKGLSVFGKGGFRDHWSINGSLYLGEDDEDGLEFDLTQLNVGVAYNFLDGRLFRPFVQAGLGWADVSNGTSDSGTGLMLGAGAEIGGQAWAFYGAADYSQVELFDVDFDILNWTAGGIFKF
jgi:hypothetical protein